MLNYRLVRQRATTENFDEKLAALTQQEKDADAATAACTKWRLEAEALDSMIVAGEVLLAGGDNQVLAIESNTGQQLWTAKTDGKAKGLAVADGRLLVSTDKGTIQCFGKGPKPTSADAETVSDPYPRDQLTLYYQRAAQLIVRSSGVEKGYCLVLGCGTGRLAYELAKRTDLKIYGIEPDAKKVEIARERLDAAGMYGNRITVEQAALDAIPYSNYFANLIVSEEALISGRLSTPADEAIRMLKPCGGVLCIGQPATRADIVEPLSAETLNNWVSSAGISEGSQPTDSGATWLNFARGPLEGAGKWTHQYGDPGNTASSEDTLVKAPLRLLWYGEPGPDKVPSRHYRNTAPLSINGRVFQQGINRIMCFDAYNGFMYWEREIEGAYRVRMARECGNLACNEDSLFVATGLRCLRLDAATGLTQATYEMPASEDETERTWAYVAVVDNLLFGSTSAKSQTSDSVFAVDIETGELKWVHHGKNIRNNTIAIDDGRVFFADDRATEEQRQVGLKQMAELVEQATGSDAPSADEAATDADVRMVVALDAATGEVAWEEPVDLTDCGGTILFSICNNGVLVFAGSYINGHYWTQFLGGDYASRRATALSTKDGSLLWSKAVGCRIRPLVIGDTFYAEPWRFDLHTGEQQMRTNPVTGETVPWKFERPGHHCGCISGSPNALFFRSWTSAYYDLLSDHGTQHFGGQRPGCWINMIPANGLLIEPEASSGCACLHSLTSTVVFEPCATNRMWGVYSSAGETTPVKHLAINVGGPGDRKDKDGELWLAYPRPRGRMLLSFKMETEILPECGYFNYGEEDWGAVNADSPWLYASGCAGMTSCTVPLVKEEDGAARYTVRLGFADSENTGRGKRVFDIKLQGKLLARNFDVVAAAGGQSKAVVEEFNGIEVKDSLNIELVPKAENTPRDEAPILNTIEVIRE